MAINWWHTSDKKELVALLASGQLTIYEDQGENFFENVNGSTIHPAQSHLPKLG
jgi:hypothetical protein